MGGQGAIVLVVDDDRGFRQTLQASLKAHGYCVYEAVTGEQALDRAAAIQPDVILLDLGLPDVDGKEVTRRLRRWTQTPVIILSVRDANSEKIAAFDAGADDYLTKPVALGELLSRLRAARRRPDRKDSILIAGEVTIDLVRKVVRVGEDEVVLACPEYELLKLLILNMGRVLTDGQLIRELWRDSTYENGIQLLRLNIAALRRKLEPDPTRPRYILTEPGVGYRFQSEG